MEEAIQTFKDYTTEEDDNVAREYLAKAGDDPMKAMALYFGSKDPAEATQESGGTDKAVATPSSEDVKNFKDFTCEESDEAARQFLEREGNNHDRAVQLYFDVRRESADIGAATAVMSTDEDIQSFMDFTSEESVDVAKQYLALANNDASRAMQLYFESKGFPTDVGPSLSTVAVPAIQSESTVVANQWSGVKQGYMEAEDLKQKWLQSEPTWKQRLGEGWQGIKVLGQGGFGIAGLWKYQESATKCSLETNEVVVKQSLINRPAPTQIDKYTPEPPIKRSPYDEGTFLQLLAALNSRHIIRQYGCNHTDTFNDREVVRIFLEFCPGGDLRSLQDARPDEGDTPTNLDERDVWAVFNCLALGVAAMDRGSEDPNVLGPRDAQLEICHFDIKTDNVLLGYHDDEHVKIPICKIADFGEAIALPRIQDGDSGRIRYYRGDMDWWPPEENPRGTPLQNPRKGTVTNIFQVGCVIYNLMIRRLRRKGHTPPFFRRSQAISNTRLQQGFTHGIELEGEANMNLYSSALRELVMECMMREPLLRPTSLELQLRTSAGLEMVSQASGISGPVTGCESTVTGGMNNSTLAVSRAEWQEPFRDLTSAATRSTDPLLGLVFQSRDQEIQTDHPKGSKRRRLD